MCFCGRVTATDDPCKYDEDDPDDRRKSQVLMMAKLDEIERVSVQLLWPASTSLR